MAKSKKKKDKVEKVTVKADAKSSKKSAKAELVASRANLALAKSQKRKWLVILIVVLLGAYFALKSGGINFGGIIDKVKGLAP